MSSGSTRFAGRWLAASILVFAALVSLFFLVLRAPPAHLVDVGTPGDKRFAAGFFLPERQDGLTFRWSGPDAQFRLHGAAARPFTLDLRLFSPPRAAEAGRVGLRLERRSDDVVLAFAAAGAPETWRVYRLLLPPREALSAEGNAVALEFDGDTYRPGADDGRDLGVPLDWLRITPLQQAPAGVVVPLQRALMLTALVGVVFGALARLLAFVPAIPATRAAAWAALPAAVLALLLLWWAATNPYSLASALPVAPWLPGLLALLLLVLGRGNLAAHAPPAPTLGNVGQRSGGLLLLVFGLALAMRFYHLADLPYGLWRDEARHGLIALRMLDDPTYRPIYVASGGVNMPALGFYPFALALKLWGIHPWSMRVMTALAGALTVFPLYALLARLYARRDLALLAAALLAVSSWHIAMSRFSFPAVFDPLLTLTGLWLLLLGWSDDAGRRGWLALAAGGVCLGLALQTYHTGRAAPLLAAGLALLLLVANRRAWRRWLARVAVLAASFLLTISPILGYALRNPGAFTDRTGEVFLLSEAALEGQAPLEALDDSLARHLLMFNLRGDSNGRHHAPGAPLLDMLSGLGFLAGVALLLWRWRDWRSLLLLGALATTLLPSLAAVEGPHAMRSIGAAAFACSIAAYGWLALLGRLPVLLRGLPVRPVAAAGVVLLALLLNGWLYFVAMPVDPRVWQAVYPVHTQMGAYIRNTAQQHAPTYVAAPLADNAVFLFLTHGVPVRTYDRQRSEPPPPSGARVVLSGYTYQQTVDEVAAHMATSLVPMLAGPPLPGREQPAFVVYEVP